VSEWDKLLSEAVRQVPSLVVFTIAIVVVLRLFMNQAKAQTDALGAMTATLSTQSERMAVHTEVLRRVEQAVNDCPGRKSS
jgi:hypothetical protein